jgi:DNA-binding NarL/FixJ family response regulator
MKVLIADDHALFRQGLTQFMSAGFKDLSITEAGSFYDVLGLNSRLPEFDLILLDLAMPGMDGFAGVAMVREHAPDVPLVIVSASERREDVLRALDLGVTGYISKSMTGRELLEALATVLAGQTYLPASLMKRAPPTSASKARPCAPTPFCASSAGGSRRCCCCSPRAARTARSRKPSSSPSRP